MLNLSPPEIDNRFDIGRGDLYVGQQYSYPYFFENSNKKMMRDMGRGTIDFKTWKGEYFQFYLGKYHGNSTLILTSTLLDCCFFNANRLGIDKMRDWATQQSEKKHPIKNSFSGYFTFGKKLLEQYDTLEKHMEEQEIYFSDEVLEEIYRELVRREKDGNK